MKTPHQALVKMRVEPRRYFSLYPTLIQGNPGPSGIYQFNIAYHYYGLTARHNGLHMGRWNRHRTPIFTITEGVGGHGAHNFQAYWIQTVNENAVVAFNAINGFLLPDPPAHNYMLTTQLSGCSFFVEPDPGGGGLNIAHIRPNGGNAAGLRTNVINTGAFAGVVGGGGLTVYGSGAGGVGEYNHNVERITIAGVYNGGWTIWAQSYVIDIVHNDLPIQRAAVRIWP